MSQKVLDALMAAMPGAVVRTSSAHGDETAWIKRDELVAVATWLRDDPKTLFDAPVFCTCTDWLDWKPQSNATSVMLRPGAVVGNQDPVVGSALRRQAAQHRQQCVGSVVGEDYEGRPHEALSAAWRRCSSHSLA